MSDEPKRWCRGCTSLKPASSFYANALMPDGYETQCKTCKRLQRRSARVRRARKPAEIEERQTQAVIRRERERAQRIDDEILARLRGAREDAGGVQR